jgi:ClpP class serine protease
LVDELGGYDTALQLAKKAAKVPEGDDVKIVVYPRPKTLLQILMERRSAENSDREAVGQTLAKILEGVRPVVRQLDAIGIKGQDKDQDDVLRMMAFEAEK